MVVLSIKKGIIHYDPLAAESRRGALDGDKFVSDVGTAPYAIAETACKLVSTVRGWRDCPEDTDTARLDKAQIEDSIIYLASVLAHYVSDLGNPLNCTVHFNGWAERYPNPKSFPVGRAANEIHSRFEDNYVKSAIEGKDVEPLISPPRQWICRRAVYPGQGRCIWIRQRTAAGEAIRRRPTLPCFVTFGPLPGCYRKKNG